MVKMLRMLKIGEIYMFNGVRQIRGTISPVVDITSGVKVGPTRHIHA